MFSYLVQKLLTLVAFSILFLIQINVPSQAFADQEVATPLPCPPFVDPGGTADHSVMVSVSGSSVSGSYPGVVGIAPNAVRAVINLGGIVSGPYLVLQDTSSPFTFSFDNLEPGSYQVVACFLKPLSTTIHTSAAFFTIAAPPPDPDPVTCGPKTISINDECVPDLSQICGEGTIIQNMMCIAQSMGSMIGGKLLEINTVSLLVAAIGINPVITGLVGITIAGVAGQAVWFIHRRRKSENS